MAPLKKRFQNVLKGNAGLGGGVAGISVPTKAQQEDGVCMGWSPQWDDCGELQGYLPRGHGRRPWSRERTVDVQDPGATSRLALFNLRSVNRKPRKLPTFKNRGM